MPNQHLHIRGEQRKMKRSKKPLIKSAAKISMDTMNNTKMWLMRITHKSAGNMNGMGPYMACHGEIDVSSKQVTIESRI